MQSTLLVALGLCACVIDASAANRTYAVTVSAGEFDRRGTVVSFPMPVAFRDAAPVLRHGTKRVALQIDQRNHGRFVLDELRRGGQATYELSGERETASSSEDRRVLATKADGKVTFATSAKGTAKLALLDYQTEPGALPRENIKAAFKRGGYLHPIRTLSGRLVTDDYPPNHIHHHGVWWAWTNTEFDGRKPDFWNMGESKGRVEFVSVEETWSGPVHGGFRSRHRFVDLLAPSPVVALNETWTVMVYGPTDSAAKHWIFDLESEQECSTPHPLKLPEYRYGGVGVRGNWAWNGKDKTTFLTSEGETDRDKGNATRGRWCDMGGQVDGQPVGIAILCHPGNFRAPQPMRLHPTEPFFNFAPQQAGAMEIKPGEKYVSRYRFVVHDGPADRTELDRLWNDYAHAPTVRLAER